VQPRRLCPLKHLLQVHQCQAQCPCPVFQCRHKCSRLVTFNGKGDPVAFLERVEELCESDGVDADLLLPHLPGLLQGEAAAWCRNNRQRWCDWNGFVTDFRLFYFPVSYQEDLEVEISRRLQRPTEPVTTYLTELQTLLRRHGSLRPEQQLSWMYRNLLPEYRLYLKRSELTDAATLLRCPGTKKKKKKRCPKARLFTKIGAKLGAWCYIVLLVA
jgi:hypothetical protein